MVLANSDLEQVLGWMKILDLLNKGSVTYLDRLNDEKIEKFFDNRNEAILCIRESYLNC